MIEANPNLNFNDILTGMGGSAFMSSGNESEEEKKEEAPYGHSGAHVFRPNLTASSPYDMGAAAHDDPTQAALEREFMAHLANPNVKAGPQTESDSDAAPAAVFSNDPENDEDELTD